MHPWERHVTFHATAAPLHFHRSLCHVVVWSCNAESRNASNHMKDAECHATLFATWQGLVQESTGFPMFSWCLVLSCMPWIASIWETYGNITLQVGPELQDSDSSAPGQAKTICNWSNATTTHLGSSTHLRSRLNRCAAWTVQQRHSWRTITSYKERLRGIGPNRVSCGLKCLTSSVFAGLL